MPYKKTKKYSASQESEFRVRALEVLSASAQVLSIDDIKNKDFTLSPLTSQKLSRELNHLVEMGFVQKSKSKATGRMMYKATSVMEEQGYEIC